MISERVSSSSTLKDTLKTAAPAGRLGRATGGKANRRKGLKIRGSWVPVLHHHLLASNSLCLSCLSNEDNNTAFGLFWDEIKWDGQCHMLSTEAGTVTSNTWHLLLLSLVSVQSFYGAGNVGLINCMTSSQHREAFVIITSIWKVKKQVLKGGSCPVNWFADTNLWRPAIKKAELNKG